jgi:predicted nucleic acid-binding protein
VESASVGVILDSSFIIASERRGCTVRQILEQIHESQGDIEIGVSVVTIAELVHGAYRAKTEDQQQRRMEFIDRLASDIPVYPITIEIARIAGQIQGQEQAKGVQFSFEDLFIGVTALHLGYSIATLNVRDFQPVHGLSILKL